MRNLKPTRFRLAGIEGKRLGLANARPFPMCEEEPPVTETLLYRAASTWNSLSVFRYSFTYGFRMKLHTLNLSFSPEDFPHLAGFQYLKDLILPRYTPAKTVEKILDGTIAQEMIEKGQQYKEFVEPRLLALASLDQIMDSPFALYSYMPQMYPFYTALKADYLIASHLDDISFVFLIRNGGLDLVCDCICCSTFVKDYRDYEVNQRPYTLLKKTKTNLLTAESNILFIKPGFSDPEA